MDDLRSKVQAHWQSFDALVDSQTGGNEAILRALDIFQSASSTFKAAVEEPQERLDASNTVTSESIPLDHDVTDFVPKGGVNATPNNGRRSYLRAEEGLALAREQLARNSETLSRMEEEIKGARRHIGSCYEVEEGATGQERRKTRANASVKALDRGHVGCQISPVEMARIMGALLRMHQNELEMQETIVYSLGYDTPGKIFTAYRAALDLRPFMDTRFLEQIQEVRMLSEELEGSASGKAVGEGLSAPR